MIFLSLILIRKVGLVREGVRVHGMVCFGLIDLADFLWLKAFKDYENDKIWKMKANIWVFLKTNQKTCKQR